MTPLRPVLRPVLRRGRSLPCASSPRPVRASLLAAALPFAALFALAVLAAPPAYGRDEGPKDAEPAGAAGASGEDEYGGDGEYGEGADDDGGGGDPLEPANRFVHRSNLFFDRKVLGPTARFYVKAAPRPVRKGVSNFLSNLSYPGVILNDFLQGKFEQGVRDTMRFVFNTTFGLGGLIDFSTGVGLERREEDFGQTLGVWGVEEVAYLELPVLGPSSVRDAAGIPVRWWTNLLVLAEAGSGLAVPFAVLNAIDTRAKLESAIETRDRVALDTYVFTREAYRQRRAYLIHDGDPPEGEEEDGLYD